MPIGDYPIVEVIVRQLAHYHFDSITMAVNHQADIVKAFFGDGKKWGVRIDYSLENQPLSTIGPLCLIDDLPENFLLLNGDVLTDLNLEALYCNHVKENRLFTIAASKRTHTIDYGVLDVDSRGTLTNFSEKPSVSYLVSMGIYVVNKSVLSLVPPRQPYGFDNLMRDLLAQGQHVSVQPHEGYWLDIGRPDDYVQAIEEFDSQKSRFLQDE
jgi:NDP-sugar pyrophosphorylase family protein